MKNPFSAIFLISLSLLTIAHSLNCIVYQSWEYSALLFFFSSFILFKYKKLKHGYLFIAFAIALLVTSQFIKQKQFFYQIQEQSFPPDSYISIEGKLDSFPEIHSDHSIIYLETQSFEFNKKKSFQKVNIRIKVNGNLSGIHCGDLISISARVYPSNFNKNFFSNPLKNYQLVQNCHFNGYCKSVRLVSVIKKAFVFWRLIGDWRNKIREAIQINLPTNRGAILQALLIGERGQLSDEKEEELLNAGVYHLLAISGAHIGIIAFLCLGIFKLLHLSSKKRYIFTAGILILFLILSGFKISAERAVLMAVLIFVARILSLDTDIFNIISFCGLLLLIRNPAVFLDAGFVLTFSLTASIIIGRRVFLPLLERWEFFIKKPLQIGEFLSANLSASLMALPLSIYFFKRYSFAGFISGLLLIPITAVITGLGLLVIPLAIISPLLTGYLLKVIDLPLRLFLYIISLFSKLTWLNIYRASPPLVWILLVFLIFIFLSISKSIKKKIILSGILLFFLLTISVDYFHYSPQNLEVFYLDVGQGDSQVIVFPGGDALLIDGGGAYYSDFKVGRNILLPFLLQKRINIKWIAVSHFHPDHAYGIAEIIHIVKPEELWISSEATEEPGYKKLIHSLPLSVKKVQISASKGILKKIGGCTITVLFPEKYIKTTRSHNNHSLVIKISDDYHSFLFPGDIEKEVEILLQKQNCLELRSDVLKVPHHGSASSSSPGFLHCVNPQLAIFSYGVNNRFGFPHIDIVKNYRDQKISWLSTARSGGIHLISLPMGIKIERSK